MFIRKPLSVAVATVMSSVLGTQAFAQAATEEVVVTGIRGSLMRALDVKRDATGVVDAISSEDIGKMPDSNLAESLQRITGVSINRVNGEGSEVTVRGFGGNFNLVTVNGRQLPSANVSSITGNFTDQGSAGVSRSFDFSNLASEGVSGIQVYKTGRASVPTGGVGATINIDTLKPLTAGGTKVSVGLKAVEDTGGDDTTPEVSGLFSWANDEGTFGVSVFGSYQERDSGSRHYTQENWNPAIWGPETAFEWGMQNATLINEPEIGQVVARPNAIGIGLNEDERERTNGQLTLQFAPNDEMTITADAMYAENVQKSVAIIDGVWNQNFHESVEFDGNPVVATVIRQQEVITGGGGVDFFFQNLSLGVEDTLEAFGLNFDWQMRDDLKLVFDASTAEAESLPAGPLGKNAIRMNIAGPVAGWRAWDFTTPIPNASVVIADARTSGVPNGVFDMPDVGTQVTREIFSQQLTETDQVRFSGTWDVQDDLVVAFGASYLGTEMAQKNREGELALGGWGIDNPGDIPEGLFTQTCTACEFEEFDPSQDTPGAVNAPGGADTVPVGTISWRGDALALTQAMGPIYGYTPGEVPLVTNRDNLVEEEIWAAFLQADFDGQLAGMDTHVTVGLRYEETEVTATSNQFVTQEIQWTGDNDFRQILSSDQVAVSGQSSYNNFLPSIDFSINFTEDVKGRASFSQTLARPVYDRLFSATTVDTPSGPTFFGVLPGGGRGNPALDPLESNNVDLSVEWYYGDANLLSLGYYRKDVQNFVGTEIVEQPLFGLRDPSSGASGTRSGDAAEALETGGFDVTERNLFTMTAVLDNPGDFPNGAADFDPGQAFADTVFGLYDIAPNSDDPFFTFGVQQPLNTETATIYGWEFVSQHWFGDTGLGYQFNYTTVEGDIEYDVGGDPTTNQFALEGLSDSLNLVLIFEKYGVSARLLYNWRDDFLNQAQRSASGSRVMPEFIDEYEQWDFNISYDINENFSVTLDAINITEEEAVHYGRSENQVFFIQELDTRYMLGVRYTM